jgi:hypothetical protein
MHDTARLVQIRLRHDELALTLKRLADRYGCRPSRTQRVFDEVWSWGRQAHEDYTQSAQHAHELGDEDTWE